MKMLRLNQLPDNRSGHFLKGLIDGEFLSRGTMSYKKPNVRTHSKPHETTNHVHDDCEVFIILQGKARMELDGKFYPMTTGDVFIVEPGEDHHLISDAEDPCINIWLHAGAERHPDQKEG